MRRPLPPDRIEGLLEPCAGAHARGSGGAPGSLRAQSGDRGAAAPLARAAARDGEGPDAVVPGRDRRPLRGARRARRGADPARLDRPAGRNGCLPPPTHARGDRGAPPTPRDAREGDARRRPTGDRLGADRAGRPGVDGARRDVPGGWPPARGRRDAGRRVGAHGGGLPGAQAAASGRPDPRAHRRAALGLRGHAAAHREREAARGGDRGRDLVRRDPALRGADHARAHAVADLDRRTHPHPAGRRAGALRRARRRAAAPGLRLAGCAALRS